MHLLKLKNATNAVARLLKHGMFAFLAMENLKPVIGATGEALIIGVCALDATEPVKFQPRKRLKMRATITML